MLSLSLKIALASLKAHRLRTILAIVGVALGAMALTGVQHVSQAMYRKAELETAKFGTNLFVARSGQIRFRRSGSASSRNATRTFSLADARMLLGQLPQVQAGVPFIEATMPVRFGGTLVVSQLVATWPDYVTVRNFHPDLGRFITADDLAQRRRVCVLGRKIASRLFGTAEAALGQTVYFYRAPVEVVGVMEAKGADILGSDQDEQLFVPLSTQMRRFANQDWITGVYLQLRQADSAEAVKAQVRALLRQRHRLDPGERDDFTLLTGRDRMELQQQALDLVQTLGGISSGVSFAVGGLGILSIMVLLVRARRLEIGVRRAVGARRRDILGQFILEAVLMAGTGGLIGLLLAGLLLAAVYHFGAYPAVISPAVILLTLGGSVLLGILAGAYPAWQAARMQILDVLKAQ